MLTRLIGKFDMEIIHKIAFFVKKRLNYFIFAPAILHVFIMAMVVFSTLDVFSNADYYNNIPSMFVFNNVRSESIQDKAVVVGAFIYYSTLFLCTYYTLFIILAHFYMFRLDDNKLYHRKKFRLRMTAKSLNDTFKSDDIFTPEESHYYSSVIGDSRVDRFLKKLPLPIIYLMGLAFFGLGLMYFHSFKQEFSFDLFKIGVCIPLISVFIPCTVLSFFFSVFTRYTNWFKD